MTPMAVSRLVLPVSERDHIRGPSAAPVTLVEYGDYECPHCGEAYYIVKELERHHGKNVRFVFRNFPLSTAHPNAESAAEAAEAAGVQNQFWEMHDQLFENQQSLERENLVEYAKLIGLDLARFIQEMNQHRYAKRVHEDFLSGVRSGVNGTPTFFVNGIRHDGSYDLASLLAAIRRAGGESS
jgi:protein-disulfide isomerase